jgi:cation diffusion facilitator family transporter
MRTGLVVAATLALDGLFFAVNLYVFHLGGSRAVLSQAVETSTDLAGSVMILWGQRASRLPASSKHPFGRGKERFFWAYSAGLVTFSLAGALVFVEGLLQMLSPHLVGDVSDGLLTVGGTFIASFGSFAVVVFEVRRDQQSLSELIGSSHMGVKTIFLQDIVSIAGATVALTGLVLVHETGVAFFDGLAAAIVGALLLLTGFVLGGEAREFLVGRAITDAESHAVLALVERYPYVRHVLQVQSMVLGPEDHLIVLRVNFLDEMDVDDVEMHVDQLRRFVIGEFPKVKHLIIEPVRAVGEQFDAGPSAPKAPPAPGPSTKP